MAKERFAMCIEVYFSILRILVTVQASAICHICILKPNLNLSKSLIIWHTSLSRKINLMLLKSHFLGSQFFSVNLNKRNLLSMKIKKDITLSIGALEETILIQSNIDHEIAFVAGSCVKKQGQLILQNLFNGGISLEGLFMRKMMGIGILKIFVKHPIVRRYRVIFLGLFGGLSLLINLLLFLFLNFSFI